MKTITKTKSNPETTNQYLHNLKKLFVVSRQPTFVKMTDVVRVIIRDNPNLTPNQIYNKVVRDFNKPQPISMDSIRRLRRTILGASCKVL